MLQIQKGWLVQLKKAISTHLKISESRLSLGTNLRDDLNLDPLDFKLLIAELERNFNVFLSQEQISEIQTLQDICMRLQPQGMAA